MTSIRPAKPRWEQGPGGLVAATAIGEFSVSKGEDGYWRAQLNDGPFPILYEQESQAKTAATMLACLAGHPAGIDVEWISNDADGVTAVTMAGQYHVVPSESISGFFVMHEDSPASTPLSSQEEAQEACAQYLVFVWFALSEVIS
jgi:hypothetical protein